MFFEVQIILWTEASSAHNANNHTVLYLKTIIILLWAAEVLCAYVSFHYVYLSQDLIKSIIFTASSKTFLSEAGILSSAGAYWWRIRCLPVHLVALPWFRLQHFYPPLFCIRHANVSTVKRQIMSQYSYKNSFDLLKGYQGTVDQTLRTLSCVYIIYNF